MNTPIRNSMQFQDKVIIITGAATGIGRTTAIEFAKRGANVLVADVDEENGKETTRMINEQGGKAFFQRVDVSKENEVKAMVDAAVGHFGKINYAFNNAGVAGGRIDANPLEETLENWQRVIDINLTGVFLCMKHEVKQFLEQGTGGVIVNTSSILGKQGAPFGGAYTASKHGVMGITKTYAHTFAKQNIRVCAINPSFIDTPLMKKSRIDKENPRHMRMLKGVPMGRMGTVEEVANGVAFLCSDDASFITGLGLNIDGGLLS